MSIRDKITKGPWGVYENSGPTSVYCDDDLGNRVAKCTGAFSTLPIDQREANAKAISKVPEMLDIIERLAAVDVNNETEAAEKYYILNLEAINLLKQLNNE